MVRKHAGAIMAKVSKNQVAALSEIAQNIGHVLFGSMTLNSLLKDVISWGLVGFGFVSMDYRLNYCKVK
jgi:hypothetical protein